MVHYKCTKNKRNARYIREVSCLKAAHLTKNLKAREGIVKEIGRLGTSVVQTTIQSCKVVCTTRISYLLKQCHS